MVFRMLPLEIFANQAAKSRLAHLRQVNVNNLQQFFLARFGQDLPVGAYYLALPTVGFRLTLKFFGAYAVAADNKTLVLQCTDGDDACRSLPSKTSRMAYDLGTLLVQA